SAIRPSILYRDILALDVTEITETLLKRGHKLRIGKPTVDNSNYRRPLLRARRERPCSRRAAEQRHELATVHSMTSSARASSVGGTSRPSDLAVLRLITSSYFVGACTGRSAGFSPLRMRST